MKKVFLAILALLGCSLIFGQQNEPLQGLTKEDYLQKSMNQNTIGWVMLGGGTVLVIAGIIVANSAQSAEGWFELSPGETAGGIMFLAGLAADLLSIPVFISSAKNARKAATIGFNNQRILIPGSDAKTLKMQPSVSLKIRF